MRKNTRRAGAVAPTSPRPPLMEHQLDARSVSRRGAIAPTSNCIATSALRSPALLSAAARADVQQARSERRDKKPSHRLSPMFLRAPSLVAGRAQPESRRRMSSLSRSERCQPRRFGPGALGLVLRRLPPAAVFERHRGERDEEEAPWLECHSRGAERRRQRAALHAEVWRPVECA